VVVVQEVEGGRQGGVSASVGGKRTRIGVSKRGVRPSFELFGIRFGWKLF
jgi:hypothetical protein